MSGAASSDPESFDCVIEMAAAPETVFAAFFSRDGLRRWWGVIAAVTDPRPLGVYAVEWARSTDADALIGPWGGAFYGIVIDVRPGREFFLADAYWMPPQGDPIGPMALHVTCDPTTPGTRLRFHVSGCDDSQRWRRFYRVIGASWGAALAALRDDLSRPVES
jgi:uncharacterized protein YndB with AHSA1/START domain